MDLKYTPDTFLPHCNSSKPRTYLRTHTPSPRDEENSFSPRGGKTTSVSCAAAAGCDLVLAGSCIRCGICKLNISRSRRRRRCYFRGCAIEEMPPPPRKLTYISATSLYYDDARLDRSDALRSARCSHGDELRARNVVFGGKTEWIFAVRCHIYKIAYKSHFYLPL